MKVKSAKFVGLVDLWTKVWVELVIGLDAEVVTGHILFENDGRDIDTEGLDLATVCLGLVDLDNVSMKILETEIEKGSVAYEAIEDSTHTKGYSPDGAPSVDGFE